VLYPPFGYHLQGWGRKVLRELYGTVRPEDGRRQYRKAYISTGKQNGKSFIIGGLPIYHLLMEDELQPQAYGVASARDQAGIVYDAAAMLVNANQVLTSQLKVLQSVKRIIRRDGGGLYAVLSADGHVQDGKRPSLLLFDELHRFTRKKAETVRTVLLKGMISRCPVVDGIETGEPLMIQVTTSGDEKQSPLWASEYDYAKHVIDGSINDDTYYARIWQADPKRIENDREYWKSREARVAANPSHEDNGGFLADKEIEHDMLEAVRRPEQYGDFVRLNLNVPVVATGTPVIDMNLWYEGSGGINLKEWPEYDVELLMSKWGLASRPCVVGIDMAWTTDMASLSVVFPPQDSDDSWRVLLFFWLPQERIQDIERITRAPLTMWVRQKFLETSPGAEIDMAQIMNKVKWAAGMFDVREVTFDRWGGVKAASDLELVPEGMTCIDIPQTFAGLSVATKKFIGLYMNKRLAHANNPIMNWHVSCLALKTDGGDNAKPEKPARDTSQKRIDGVAATVTALARAIFMESEESVYETGGIKFI
jgi:phage terminase large subunit-like protein